MFNPGNLASEVFGILRSFDYTVHIFDYDGNRVYEPEEARRFFATPKNITVSIAEDGENSNIKLFLGGSVEVSEVMGLIDTMRTMAAKFGVLFNVKNYDRELKPKDLAPNAMIETAGDNMIPINEKQEEKIDLPALGCSVELNAWTAFKNGQLAFYSPPEIIDEKRYGPSGNMMVLRLRAIADKVKADGMANMFSRVSDALENGSKDKLLGLIAQKAIDIAYSETIDEGKDEMIELPPLGCSVEKNAWEAFKAGRLETISPVNLNSLKLGHNADKAVLYLRAIADKVKADGMANMLSRISGEIEDGRSTPLMMTIAKTAINAVSGATKSEPVITNEAVREFGKWFDRYSPSNPLMFENEKIDYLIGDGSDDAYEQAVDLAVSQAEDDFNVEEYLAVKGDDFNWGDDSLSDDDKSYDEAYVKSSLEDYLYGVIDGLLGDEESYRGDITSTVNALLPQVEGYFTDHGWEINKAIEEDMITTMKSIGSNEIFPPKDADKNVDKDDAEDDAEDTDAPIRTNGTAAPVDPNAKPEDEDEDEELLDEGDDCELTSEDVLLPSKEDDDFTREILSDDDETEITRMRSLAGIKASASPAPRIPQS